MVEHVDIPDGERHEPKGANSAAAGEIYIADGANSGAWAIAMPHGGWRYSNIGTGTTFTTPTSYTLMNVVGVATSLRDFTNNGLGRLTYTGTDNKHMHLVTDFTLKHSTGSGTDLFFQVYKNGVATGAIKAITADSSNYYSMALNYDTEAVTNDYFEIYLKTGSGSLIVHESYMFAVGML